MLLVLMHSGGGMILGLNFKLVLQLQAQCHIQLIGDVANWKRHQRLDEILIFFFTHTTSEKSAKLFSKKLLSCNTPTKLNAILFAQHTLAVMHTFHTA